MKKLLSILFVLCAFSAALGADAFVTGSDSDLSQGRKPLDVSLVTLFDNTAQSTDTLATTEIRWLGPYNLCDQQGEPMFSKMKLYGSIVTGTTPVCAIDYVLLPNGSLSDTATSPWVALDTLQATARTRTVDLSGETARFIAFRVNNYDATTTVIPNYVYMGFKRNIGFNIEKRE